MLLLVLACRGKDSPPLLPNLDGTPGAAGQVFAAFGDETMVSGTPVSTEAPPPESGDPRELLPAVSLQPDRGCYFARPGFYHRHETGLRLSYCSAEITDTFRETLRAAFSEPDAAHATFRSGRLEAGILTPAGLRDHIGPLDLLYCERDCSIADILKPGHTIRSSPLVPASDEAWLPRRFHERGFDLAIASSTITVIHAIAGSERLFYVRIDDADSAPQIRSFLERQASGQSGRLAQAIQNGVFISGIYPGSVGGSGQERLILSSGDEATTVSLGTSRGTSRLYLMPRSSVVLRRGSPDGFRFLDSPEITIDGGAPVIPPGALDRAVQGQVLTRNGRDAPFLLGAPCVEEDPCSPGDLHPSLYGLFPEDPLPLCQPEDLVLTEENPFGVIHNANGPMDPAGKFLEFRVARACLNRTLVIESGTVRLSPPLRLQQGLLVLAASRHLFEINTVERSALRRLAPDTIRVIADDGSGRITTYPNNPLAHFVPGTRTDGGSPERASVRRVHSLSNGPGGLSFHDASCSGLLRTLCPYHAMNPGSVSAEDEAELLTRPQLLLSEEVPFGNERFLEFFCLDCVGQKGMVSFRIIRTSDQREDVYVMPVPRANRITIAAHPVCGLPEQSRIHFSDLYIPAQAHRIWAPNEDIVLTSEVYDLLKREKRSLTRLPDGSMAPSTDDPPDGCSVHATPGSGLASPVGWP